jgi:ABC-type multidrug transport system permease subunit
MNNIFLRQLKGFLLSSIKIQLRNPVILIVGFLLPICLIFTYQYTITNNISKTKVAFKSAEVTHYKKAIDYLANNTRSFELKEFGSEQEIDIALANDVVDVKLWYTISGNPSILVTSKDSNNLKNKLLETTLSNEINQAVIKDNDLLEKVKTKVNTGLINVDIGSLLEPILPVLLAFTIMVCCLSMNDLNIFNKKDNIALRRIFAAPAYPTAYVMGQSIARLAFCAMQIMFLFSVMIVAFGYRPPSLFAVLQMFIVVALVAGIFIVQNILLAALIQRERPLQIVNGIVVGVQFVLITGFLPLGNLPFLMQLLIDHLPFAAFVKVINNLTTSGLPMFSLPVISNLIVILIWAGVLTFLTNKAYRMNQD